MGSRAKVRGHHDPALTDLLTMKSLAQRGSTYSAYKVPPAWLSGGQEVARSNNQEDDGSADAKRELRPLRGSSQPEIQQLSRDRESPRPRPTSSHGDVKKAIDNALLTLSQENVDIEGHPPPLAMESTS